MMLLVWIALYFVSVYLIAIAFVCLVDYYHPGYLEKLDEDYRVLVVLAPIVVPVLSVVIPLIFVMYRSGVFVESLMETAKKKGLKRQELKLLAEKNVVEEVIEMNNDGDYRHAPSCPTCHR